jgi:hypothetical protein
MEAADGFQWGQKRGRSGGTVAQPTVAQIRAAEIPRERGRFVKPKVTKGGASTCTVAKPADERLREERDAIKIQLADTIQRHKEKLNAETAQWTQTMDVLNAKLLQGRRNLGVCEDPIRS